MKQILAENSINSNLSLSKVTFRAKKRNDTKKRKYIERDVNSFSEVNEEQPSLHNLLEKDSNNILANNKDNNAFLPEIASSSVCTEKNIMETNTPSINKDEAKKETKFLKRKHKNKKSSVYKTKKTGDICENSYELPNNNSKITNGFRNDVTPRSNSVFDYNSINQTEREIVDNSSGLCLPTKSKKKKKRKYKEVVDNYVDFNQIECPIDNNKEINLLEDGIVDNNKEINLLEDGIVELNKCSNKNNHTELKKRKSIAKNKESPYHKSDIYNQEIIIKNYKPEFLIFEPNKTEEIISQDSSFVLLNNVIGKKHKKTYDDDTWESPVVKTKKKRENKHLIFSDEESLCITQSNCKDNPIKDTGIIERQSYKGFIVKQKEKNTLGNDSFNTMPNIVVPPECSPASHSNIVCKERDQRSQNKIGYNRNKTEGIISQGSSFDLLNNDFGKKHKETYDDDDDTWESPVVKSKKKRKNKHLILSDEESLCITQSNCKDNPIKDAGIIERHSHKDFSVKQKEKNKLVNDSFNTMPNIVPPECSPDSHSHVVCKERDERSQNKIGYNRNSLFEKLLNDAKDIKKNSAKLSSAKIKVVQNKFETKSKEKTTDDNLDNSDEQINDKIKKKQKKKRNGCKIDDMVQALLSKAIENMASSSGTEVCHSETKHSPSSPKNLSQKVKKDSGTHKVKRYIPHKHTKHKSKHSQTKNDIEKIQQALISAALKNINSESKPKNPIHQNSSLDNIKLNESDKKTKRKSKKENSRIFDLEKDKHNLKQKKKKKEKSEVTLEVLTSKLLSAALKEKQDCKDFSNS